MLTENIYTVASPYREDMVIKGYSFGKGEEAACILGSERGNEMQQMYICSQLVKALKELEANGCVSAGKKILVIPVINSLGMNVGEKFFGVENQDINRRFPGRKKGDSADRLAEESSAGSGIIPMAYSLPVFIWQGSLYRMSE